MASALRKTMEYLGLAETDEYAGHGSRAGSYGELDEHGDAVDGEWDVVDGSDDYGQDPHDDSGVDDGEGGSAVARRGGYGRVVTPLHPRGGSVVASAAHEARRASVAEEAPALRRITTIHPRTYNEAKSIGESFRGGVPVIMNLTDMSDADAKRHVDFSAGLVFGLRGSIERVTNKVFLLSPEHVTVTGEAPAVRPPHLFNQS